MYILGLDTTGDTLSVALGQDNTIIGATHINTGKKHSENLLLAIDGLLALCKTAVEDIDVFACGVGPGSYTGIRIGVATASALALGGNKKTAAINILDAMIKDISDTKTVCALLNARNGDVYVKAVRGSITIIDTNVLQITDVLKKLEGEVIFTGEGCEVYKDIILTNYKESIIYKKPYVNATDIVRLAFKSEYLSYDRLVPLYLRQTQAQRMKGKSS